MKTAIVHDWLVSPIGGGEKCLKEIHQMFPSPIYTLVKSDKGLRESYFADKEIYSSFVQRFPFAETKYRNFLPFFPLAIEQFDLSDYDCILSSSHCVAKGVLTHPEQLHICYCHTPVRYAWDLMHQYLEESHLTRGVRGAIARFFLHYLRGWDVHSASRVNEFIANSQFVARRIKKYYGKEAHVIYPPVDISCFECVDKKEGYYLTASRLVPYKKIDLIVEAFSKLPDKKLVVIGTGPEAEKIKTKAAKNIELLGFQSDDVLRRYLQNARAFVFAAIEDFGILPIEAMACGTPVIGLAKGALKETVVEGTSGLFFHEQTVESIIEAVSRFERVEFIAKEVRSYAERFSQERFHREFREFVVDRYSKFRSE